MTMPVDNAYSLPIEVTPDISWEFDPTDVNERLLSSVSAGKPMEVRVDTKSVRIVDYKGDWYDYNISMDGVSDIYLMILSGDESLRIHRFNGQEEFIDPVSSDRIESIYQGGYYIYDATDSENIYDITDNPDWMNRKDPWGYQFGMR